MMMEDDLDDLFRDASLGDHPTLPSAQDLPKGLSQVIDDSRRSGCSQYVDFHPHCRGVF